MVAYLKRLPGPVWTMAVWSALLAVDTIIAGLLPHGDEAGWLYGATLELVIVAILLIWGPRTPTWFLHVVLVSRLAGFVVVTLTNDYSDAILAGTFNCVVIVVYAAYWWHNWSTMAYAVAGSLGLLVPLFITDALPAHLQAWIVVTTLLLGLGACLNYVVGIRHDTVTHDTLTGMLNRRALESYLAVAHTPGRNVLPRAVAVIDLDDFKATNDRLGHDAGDQVLRDVAAALHDGLRADDLGVRVGGDEFLLLLPHTQLDDARRVLARLHAAAPAPWSYGIVDWPGGQEFADAYHAADQTMYTHKRRARTTPPRS